MTDQLQRLGLEAASDRALDAIAVAIRADGAMLEIKARHHSHA